MKTTLTFFILFLSFSILAQTGNVGIGTLTPDSSAALDITSTDKGVLLPRLDSTSRKSIASPAEGLVVFDSDTKSFWFYRNAAWQELHKTDAVFENVNGLIRNTSGADNDFIIGYDSIPANGDSITESMFFFDAGRKALRTGLLLNSDAWAKDSLGVHSIASGLNSKAVGNNSSAFGSGCEARGNISFSAGEGSKATGVASTSFGVDSEATGDYTFAAGTSAKAKGEYATAFGFSSEANGTHASAVGYRTRADAYNSVALGRYNTGGGNETAWVGTDPLLEVGIGINNANRQNAFTILKDGSISFKEYAFPNVDGTTNQVLQTDGSGNLTWNTLPNGADNLGNHLAVQDLDMSTQKITNLANPTMAGDGTNKFYVDGALAPLIADIADNANDITTNVLNINNNAANIANNTIAINTHTTNDTDLSPTNEIQTLSILGQDVSISGGNTITLPSTDVVFENNAGVVRNTGSNTDDFIFGDVQLPQNGVDVNESMFFFDKSKAALRVGDLTNSPYWSPDSIGTNSISLGVNTLASNTHSLAFGYLTKSTGFVSTTMGQQSEANGDYSTAMGLASIANGISSTAMGQQALAFGEYATSIGYRPYARGDYATAIGHWTDARGDYSTAMGYYSDADGDYSTAIGSNTDADGTESMAIGSGVTAEAYRSIALGSYNTGLGNNTNWIPSDPILEVGIGSDMTSKENGLTILKNGTVSFKDYTFPNSDGNVNQVMKTDGSGNLSWTDQVDEPVFENNVGVVRSTGATTDDFIFGDTQLPQNGVNVNENIFFFDESKGAFRTGHLSNSTNWATDSLGLYSFAAGNSTKAKGSYSSAFGQFSNALGSSSFVAGSSSKASGQSSFAMGFVNEARGDYSIAMGSSSVALSDFSVAIGNDVTAYETGVAIGQNVTAIYGSTAIGRFNLGQGNHVAWLGIEPVFEIGIGTDNLNKANAMTVLKNGKVSFKNYSFPNVDGNTEEVLKTDGSGNISWSAVHAIEDTEGDTHISFNNVDNKIVFSTNNNVTAKIEPDSMFIDGNLNVGTGLGSRVYLGNTMMQSGGPTILRMDTNIRPYTDDAYGLGSSGKRWNVVYATNGTIQTSDKRLKKNIITISHGLETVLKMNPVQYHWKKETDEEKQHLGLIAQDLLKLVPEVVNNPENKEDLLGVKYAELVPVLIKAIQEQNEVIESQENTISNIQNEMADLKEWVKTTVKAQKSRI